MSIHAWQTLNYISMIHRSEPIWKGMAWLQKIPDFAPLGQRKNQQHLPQAETFELYHHSADVFVSQIRGRSNLQIPIDYRQP